MTQTTSKPNQCQQCGTFLSPNNGFMVCENCGICYDYPILQIPKTGTKMIKPPDPYKFSFHAPQTKVPKGLAIVTHSNQILNRFTTPYEQRLIRNLSKMNFIMGKRNLPITYKERAGYIIRKALPSWKQKSFALVAVIIKQVIKEKGGTLSNKELKKLFKPTHFSRKMLTTAQFHLMKFTKRIIPIPIHFIEKSLTLLNNEFIIKELKKNNINNIPKFFNTLRFKMTHHLKNYSEPSRSPAPLTICSSLIYALTRKTLSQINISYHMRIDQDSLRQSWLNLWKPIFTKETK